MKRIAIVSILVASACGGGGKNTPLGGDVIVRDDTDKHPPVDPTPTDPALAARLVYANPGGMWMPQQMTLPGHVETFSRLGVTIPAGQLSDPLAAPLAAVVSLGGCTASFVSPEGLVITNHHCVRGALQHNSPAGAPDLVENGFLAATRADEISAGPDKKIYVARAFTDVTAAMRDGLDQVTDPIARKREVETRQKTQVAACEKDRPGTHCKIASYFSGGEYLLIEYFEIRDVRLVYAPHRAIGNYGGEIDNWAWPRHTGDYAFYRAYVGKDGLPADYAVDNEPFHPAHYLQVSMEGVENHDFAMVVGYPGHTERAYTAAEIHHDVEWYYPYAIAYSKQKYALAEELIKANTVTGATAAQIDVARKTGVAKQSIQNSLENAEGTLAGLTGGDLLVRKDALDAKVKEWAAQPGREDKKASIDKYESLLAQKRRTAPADYDRGSAFASSRLLSSALAFTRWAEERPKADAARKPGYQDRDMPRAIASQKAMLRSYNRTLDRALFRLALVRALDLPEADRPWLATIVGAKQGQKIDDTLIDKALDRLYGGSKLEDETVRLALLEHGATAKLKTSKDAFVKLAIALWPVYKAEEKKDDERAGELVLVSPAYAAAMRAVLGGELPPDANGTLRITYGTVKSFAHESTAEADLPFTTTAQLAKKNTGTKPYDAPRAELDAIAAKAYGPYGVRALGGEIPIDFLTDLDITGGNSGSPTLDGKGRLVGLAFDGTIAGVASDVVFDGATTRTIHADIRYALWVMDALDHADHLVKEMGVEPSLD